MMKALPYVMPNNLDEAKTIGKQLSEEKIIAIDLEFDREQYTYGFTLCLLQIASPSAVVLVDPFIDGMGDLFLTVLQNSRALKLVHSSGEDVRLLHSSNCFPDHIEDTEIYARWLNLENTSLSYLLGEYCNVTLNKQQQRSNWTKRPLTHQQLEYACDDVHYLFALREKLREAAKAKNVLALAEEDIAIQAAYRFDEKLPYPYVKQADTSRYSQYELHVLNGMMKLRDDAAKAINKPQHFIIPELLFKQAILDHKNLMQLRQERAVHRVVKADKTLAIWQSKMQELYAEAEKLALLKSTKQRRNGFSNNGTNEADEAALKAIQQSLAKDFGEHTARYLLSNRTANAIFKRDQSIQSLNHSLKQRLIIEAADKLQVDISRLL